MHRKNKKKNTFVAGNAVYSFFLSNLRPICRRGVDWRDARVVEEARLESVYTPKGYPGFESPSLRILRLIWEQINIIKVIQLINLKNLNTQ